MNGNIDPARGVARQTLVHIGRDCIRHHAGADCNEEIIGMLREASKRVTGGNCAFADSDLNILEHLAGRAVEAGLTDGLHPDVARRAAQVGAHPKGGDAKQAPGDSLSDAVPEGNAP